MNQDIANHLAELWNNIGIAALFALPLAVVGWSLHRRRDRFRAETQEPFTAMPMRPRGESLRVKIDALGDEFDSNLFVAAMVSICATAIVVMSPPERRLIVASVLMVAVAGAIFRAGRRMWKLQGDLWAYRLGFMGERAVGEELNQLLALGFHVFHDLPFDGFNIDHVLVGSSGVYAVETKAWRKPANIRGLEKARIYSDGISLRHPNYINTEAIPQARRNGVALAKMLTKATGSNVEVFPILTFPGWAVIREKACDVNVLRPDEIKRSFPSRPKHPLSAEKIQKIAHHLTELCRLTKEPKVAA